MKTGFGAVSILWLGVLLAITMASIRLARRLGRSASGRKTAVQVAAPRVFWGVLLAVDVWAFFQAGVQGQTLLMVLWVFAGITAVWQLYRHEAKLTAEAHQTPDGLEPRWRAFRERGLLWRDDPRRTC